MGMVGGEKNWARLGPRRTGVRSHRPPFQPDFEDVQHCSCFPSIQRPPGRWTPLRWPWRLAQQHFQSGWWLLSGGEERRGDVHDAAAVARLLEQAAVHFEQGRAMPCEVIERQGKPTFVDRRCGR